MEVAGFSSKQGLKRFRTGLQRYCGSFQKWSLLLTTPFCFQNSWDIKKYVYTVILLWQIGIRKTKQNNSEHPMSLICLQASSLTSSGMNIYAFKVFQGLTWCFIRDSAEPEILCISSGTGTMWLLLITVVKGLHSRFQVAFPSFFFCLFLSFLQCILWMMDQTKINWMYFPNY